MAQSVRCRAGAVDSVAFRNVPSFVVARGVRVADAEVDIACGGALYAFVSADSVGVHVDPADLPELIRLGRRIKGTLEGHELARHPSDDRLSGIYGTVVHEEVGPLHQPSCWRAGLCRAVPFGGSIRRHSHNPSRRQG